MTQTREPSRPGRCVFTRAVLRPAFLLVTGTALTACSLLAPARPAFAADTRADDAVSVAILEGIPKGDPWGFEPPDPPVSYSEPAFGFVSIPRKFNARGLAVDRTSLYMLRARCRTALPAGELRVYLRSRNAARLSIDGTIVVETIFLKPNASAHEPVPPIPEPVQPGVHRLPIGHQQQLATFVSDGETHDILLEAVVGGRGLRSELGELAVCVAGPDEELRLLSPGADVPFTESGWTQYVQSAVDRQRDRDRIARHAAVAEERAYWQLRHEQARRQFTETDPVPVPEVSAGFPVHNPIDALIGSRLEQDGIPPAPLADDHAFLRRVTLDLVGVVPALPEIGQFFDDPAESRRDLVIDRLLDDPRWADHWVGYWQDVLAENPGLLKPQLNNTGPFRWWIHESFLDNKPMDRFATELVLMEGSRYEGGPAGFGMATMNDAPMVAKAHVVAKAFLGVEMQCARCHDAPYHPYRQEQLFQFGALLAKKDIRVPESSTVDFTGRARRPLVEVTLPGGTVVAGQWPFPELAAGEPDPNLLRQPDNPRERLAAVLTQPSNERFAQVLANRLWKRYLGIGLVEPVDDWNETQPSHPDLLRYLTREFVSHDYDLKHVARLILQSHTYQRQVISPEASDGDQQARLFASPARRRLSAEQLVDSLFHVAGKEFHTEPMDLAPAGRRSITQFLNLGTPRRAWQFASLSNDRDRPALSLPYAQTVVDVLTSFGWRESRQNPVTVRDHTPTVMQPLILANGVVGRRIVTLSDDHAVTGMCLEERPLEDLVCSVFERVLCRLPTNEEQDLFMNLLAEGYPDRCVAGARKCDTVNEPPLTAVSWANHLSPEASRIKLELAELAQAGDAPTERLRPAWRERMEDMLWTLVNSPEFVFIP